MQNKKIKTLLFTLIILASIASYAYLNSQKVKGFVKYSEETKDADNKELKEESYLPDMALVLELLNEARKFLPASTSGL